MNSWLEFIVIWLVLDIFIIAGIDLAVTVIKPRYPELWKRMVVDNEPDFIDYYN